MRKGRLSKIIMCVMIVSIVAAIIILPIGCSEKEPVEKKAIIILPGIMGSNIVDAETGDPLWAPLEKGQDMWKLDYLEVLNSPQVTELLDLDGPKGGFAWLDKMKVNLDGTSNHNNEAQQYSDDGTPKYERCSTYGTLQYYEKTYNYLKQNFGTEYDVRMFEYDWRLDNMKSAEALEKFINEHQYTDVVLVAHSMGGVLASTYIGRSQDNANKVSKFISLGTPFFGAHKALRVAEDPLSMISGGSAEKLLNMAKNLIDSKNGSGSFDEFFNRFLQFVHELPTIYQLIPYTDMANGYSIEGSELYGKGIINVDGKPITDYNEFMTFIKDKEWSYDGFVDQMNKWQQEQYVDGVHASKKVDTVYFVGNELETECGVNFDKDGVMTDSFYSLEGDGTVPLYSATCGLPLTDDKVIEFKGVSHGNLAYDDVCLEKIKEVILAIK